ncbi:MAG: hypothetical protein JWP06_83 [Candidatus Saccharibacteria bacterium]|nr:hypothetical protein [Candidatus Saccharibacteria bacterium]
MKRFLLGFGVGLALVITSLTSVLARPVAAQSGVDNFTINMFDADYYLAKNSEGRSTLKTIERITAVFPAFDQNHGLERAIPESYDGHSTNPQIDSVTDGSGRKLSYSDGQLSDNLVLRIGDANTYVHGEQTYVITYSQRDVTRSFTDTNADELYWDVNGTEWGQPINTIRARIHVPTALNSSLTGNISCYQGVAGSTAMCPIERQLAANETIFSLQASNLQPQENVTFAIGFASNTFVGYQQTWQEKMWSMVLAVWFLILVISSIAAVILLIWMSVKYYKVMHRIQGRGTIVAEYLPPENTSVLVSARILGNVTSDITAQLIDLAVRHYLKIYQTKEKTLFQAAEYELEIVKNIDDLKPEEQQLLKDLFGSTGVTPGSRFNMATLRKKYSISTKLAAGRKAVRKSARGDYALYERAEAEAHRFNVIGLIALAIGVVTVSPFVVIVAVVAFVFAATAWPLTQKGVELKDYLKGLKLYISVAEKDRIKMLQSPEGAEKVGEQIDRKDPAKLVKLYERVLSYAVLFGIEKEWTKQLGTYYETSGQQPDWYAGSGVFNAIIFSSALDSFSSQSSAYSSSTSSSSGGSGGGGFSGGGGGGGGW